MRSPAPTTDPPQPRSSASGQCEDAEAATTTEQCFGAVRGRGSPTTDNDLARRPHVADRRGRRPCKGGVGGGAVVAESAPRHCVVAVAGLFTYSDSRALLAYSL